jgi:hypothetical protein
MVALYYAPPAAMETRVWLIMPDRDNSYELA